MHKIELKEHLSLFLASWDEKIGPVIQDLYPKEQEVDLEEITLQIFQSFQIIFGSSPEITFNRTSISLPLKKFRKKAKIMLDSFKNEEVRGGLEPYIIVILVPEDYSDDNLKAFDDLLIKIAVKYSKEKSINISEYFEEISNIYLTEQFEKDLEISIEENYSFTAAVNDFKMGLKFFQKSNLNSAYRLIKKALLKFEIENQKNLNLEANFLLASILVQNKKYAGAIENYRKVVNLATELDNQKYQEQGTFMAGFCLFKLVNYSEALVFLEKLNVEELKFTKKTQFLTILGKTYDRLGMNNKSIEAFESALKKMEIMEDNEKLRRQSAQLYYELGLQNYQVAVSTLKTLGLRHKDALQEFMERSIEYFSKSERILESIGDFRALISLYKIISDIYSFQGLMEEQLKSLRKALDIAEKANEMTEQIKISDKIIQINFKLKKYDLNVKRIDEMFSKFTANAFIDMFSLAGYHYQKGISLVALERDAEALSEFMIAKNIYAKIESYSGQHTKTLKEIIKIYKKTNDLEKIDYYSKQLQKVTEKFDKRSISDKIEVRPLGFVKEIWIITNVGTEIFSYAPETSLDPDLLGGFLTAMQSFSIEITNEKLNAIIIGNERYSIFRDDTKMFYILGRSSIKSPEKPVMKTLRKISDTFYAKFSKRLDRFNGDVHGFSEIMPELKKIDFTLI